MVDTSTCNADVTLDGSLGRRGPLVGPNFVIPDTAGTTVGSNLFHSFDDFNLDRSQRATFTGPGKIENVLARITGGESVIDGAIVSTIPSADLYLLNTAGLVFGPNATVDVQGAFRATTAGYIDLADGMRFTSVASGNDAMLSSAAPTAFGFLDGPPSRIAVEQSHLGVRDGEVLGLVGGHVAIAGADEGPGRARLSAPGGTIDLVGVVGQAQVAIAAPDRAKGAAGSGRVEISDSTLDVSGAAAGRIWVRGGRLVIESANLLSETRAGDGGDIVLQGGSVAVRDGTPSAGIVRTRTLGDGEAGAIRIDADALRVSDGMRLRTESGAGGKGGDIHIDVRHLELETGARVETRALDSGRGGDIEVDADSVLISGGGASSTNLQTVVVGPFFLQDYDDTGPGASGNGGHIVVRARLLRLPGGRIQTSTYGTGHGGRISIEAEQLFATNPDKIRNSGIRSRVGDGDIPRALTDVIRGDAGDLVVRAAQIEIRDGAVLDTSTFGAGNAGELTVEAREILLSGAGASPAGPGSVTGLEAESHGAGDGGVLTVVADVFEIRDGASVSVTALSSGDGGNAFIDVGRVRVAGGRGITIETFGTGRGGLLEIRSRELEVLGPASISATVGSIGAGGDIFIDAGEVRVTGLGANISVSSIGNGDGGMLAINAGRLDVSGPAAFVSGFTLADGAGGDVHVTADSVRLTNGGVIRATTFGSGDAGDVTIVARDLRVVGNRTIPERGRFDNLNPFTTVQTSAVEDSTGNAGNVSITATDIELRDGATVESSTSGPGRGGSIAIVAGHIAVRSGARIDVSTLASGPGGDIDVKARTISLSGEGSKGLTGVAATAEAGSTGNAGNITIVADDSFDSFRGALTAAAARSDGGNIDMSVTRRFYLSDSAIETAVRGGVGSGGNITIDPEFVILSNSRIVANAFGGPGGNIRIVARNFIADTRSVVEASSAAGIDGTVIIESPESDVTTGLAVLPEAFLDASKLLLAPCAARRHIDSSSLRLVGRGGLSAGPEGYLPSASTLPATPEATKPGHGWGIAIAALPSSTWIGGHGGC